MVLQAPAPVHGVDASEIQFDILRGGREVVDRIAHEWDELCDRGKLTQPFFRPYLASAYIDAFAPGSSVAVVTARRGGLLVAVLPLVERTVGVGALKLRWLHSAANEHFTQFDVIHAEEDAGRLADALWQFLDDCPDWDVVQIDSAPGRGVADLVRGVARMRGARSEFHGADASPYIVLDNPQLTLDDYLAGLPKKRRYRLRRALKRLRQHGEVSLVRVGAEQSFESLHRAVQDFYHLEHASWKGQTGTSILSDPATRMFYDQLTSEAAARGELQMYRLEVDGTTVAMDLGLASGKVFLDLKTTYDAAYHECSPGNVLLALILVELSRSGFIELDLGGGAEPYKMEWTDSTRGSGSVFLFRPGMRGQLAWNLLFRAGPKLRHRLGDTSLMARVWDALR